MPTPLSRHDALHALFHPRAVAVVGASDDTTKHGYIVLKNLRDAGFRGGVYGISRRLRTMNGIPCFPDLGSVPEPVDVAFLAVPAEAAIQAVRNCARAGVKVAIVGSAGYSESLDADGERRQAELARAAAEEGIRIVGPNCNGTYNAHQSLSIGFNTSHAKRQPAGGVSIFSHSGALFDAMAGRLNMLGAGLSLFASAGNEADLSVLDYMEYALSHEPTRVLALLIDSLPDGPRFRDIAARALQNGKDVVVLKIGNSEAGARAAVAHSSRMAGDAAAYAALFDAAGVATAASLEGLMTAGALLARYGRQQGALGAMSTSGAGSSLIADRCTALGVKLASFTAETAARIDSFRKFSRIGNPLDLGIFGGLKNARDVPTALMTDPGVGVGLALVHSLNAWQGDPIRAGLFGGKEVSGKPLLVVSPGGMPADERALYENRGVEVFTETDIVLEGIGALMTPLPAAIAVTRPAAAPALARRQLTEAESLRLLSEFGVPAVETHECSSFDDASRAAAEAGYPVVLKGVVEGVAHKSDLGLVQAGLRDRAALEAAYKRLNTGRAIVQPMIRGDLEVIAGVSRSPDVGLVLLAGLGGIYAEALRETVLWPIPAAAEAITAKLKNSAIGRVLASPRWHHLGAMAAFTELLLHLQDAALALSDQLEAVDINPVLLGAHGAIAVDALIVPHA